ncbi:OmpW/AlkL family protein [Methylocapsa palsarum]|uniref:Outer membrane protein n=1 Tax=Methylocapsa palsarum TaxID=1612308 RepID=A0A1I4A3S0_9HYPH|nr:OmpW family outer membrane protein [Methylocapsa palsarum]SFK50747.1 outer membrane protein [Methylocapsa palsarum]
MTPAIRYVAAALLTAFSIGKVAAADLTPIEPPPPPPPAFFLHVGAMGAFFNPNAQSTGGGYFNNITPAGPDAHISNAAIRPNYTLGLEAGYMVTPNWALAISAGVPPLLHAKATGFTLDSTFGTNLLGSTRWGPAMALLQYHATQFGAFQPYAGIGAVYLLNFGNISDGILVRNFGIDQTWGFALQAGADYMLTQNLGVYVDVKKLWLQTTGTGTVITTNIPIRVRVDLNPWVVGTGVTVKF